MKRELEDKKSLPEEYEELRKIIKEKIGSVTREQTEMANIFKDFVKKHEAGGKTFFIKKLQFYLDYLIEFDFKKILEALDEEIQAQKREVELTKMEMDSMKNFEESVGNTDQHFNLMKEATDKLLEFENQLLSDEA